MGLPAIVVEAVHMQKALSAQRNKTDRNDARGIAHMMRVVCSVRSKRRARKASTSVYSRSTDGFASANSLMSRMNCGAR
jgi:transposase